MPVPTLPQAPGARTAKTTGILSIVFALTCVGLPVAVVLGIVAIVMQAKAKRLAREQPGAFQAVPGTGLVTGIIGLVLSVCLVPVIGIATAIAIPAFYLQRERAMAAMVQANLKAAMTQAQLAVADTQTRVPSQDAVIRALAADPAILSLHNPFTRSAPAFQLGASGPLGTVMVYPDREEANGVTTWSIQFRARVRRDGQEQTLQGEVITHTEEHSQSRTEDGWQVVQPPPEVPVEPPVQAPAQPPAQAPAQQP